jgi:predicted amidophosphoribosyltransferase
VPTSREVLSEWAPRLGTIPSASKDFVCSFCLGPVNAGFSACLSCAEIFEYSGVPDELKDAVVPMTSALNPSPWYNALVTYKGFQRLKGQVLAAVAHHFLQTHSQSIRKSLGGAPDIITIVPSKRGISYQDQPLRAALSLAEPIRDKLRSTLTHRPGSEVQRRTYNANAFAATTTSVKKKRVALIEDTWVTGATAVSAAGALLKLGAASVGVYPIARVLNDSFWPDDHPYRKAMEKSYKAYNPSSWPR